MLIIKSIGILCLLSDHVDCLGLALIHFFHLVTTISICSDHQLVDSPMKCILSFWTSSDCKTLSVLRRLVGIGNVKKTYVVQEANGIATGHHPAIDIEASGHGIDHSLYKLLIGVSAITNFII